MKNLAEHLIHEFNKTLDYGDLDYDFRKTASYVSYGIVKKPIIYSVGWTESTLHIIVTMNKDLFEAMTVMKFVGNLNENKWGKYTLNNSQRLDDFRRIVQTQVNKYK